MSDKRATREAFGETLVELARRGPRRHRRARRRPRQVHDHAKFAAAYPERFFDVGIAEQNMIGTAAGLAVGGKIAVHRQLRRVRHRPRLRPDPQHRVLRGPRREDRAHARGRHRRPRRRQPPDARGHRAHARAPGHARARARGLHARPRPPSASPPTTPGPFYVRLGRAARAGRLRRGLRVRARPRVRAARGHATSRSSRAASWSSARSPPPTCSPPRASRAEVIDVATIKPLDADTIVASAAQDRRGRDVRGALDHRRARLGRRRGRSASARPCRMARVGVQRRVRHLRRAAELLMAHFGLTAADIAAAARERDRAPRTCDRLSRGQTPYGHAIVDGDSVRRSAAACGRPFC